MEWDRKAFVETIHTFGNQKISSDVLQAILSECGLEEAETAGEVLQTAVGACRVLESYRVFKKTSVILSLPGDGPATDDKPTSSVPLLENATRRFGGVDVNFIVEEKTAPISASAGVQFQDYDGGMNIQLHHRNVAGRLEQLGFRLFTGRKNQSLDINFVKPLFHNSFLSQWSVDVKGFREDHCKESSFRQENFQVTTTLDAKKGHSFVYQLGLRNVDLDRTARSQVVLDGGLSLKSSIAHNYAWDGRDDSSLPFEGSAINVRHELAGLGGDTHFLKQQLDLQHNIPLLDSRASLNLFSRFGTLIGLRGKKTSVCDRFFLGGPMPLRGFQHRSVGPIHQNDMLGGELLYAMGAHLTMTFPEPVPPSLCLHAFTNWGSTVALDTNNLVRTGRSLIDTTRVSVGLGLVWASPIGRIEINLCRPLRKMDTDQLRNWDFGVNYSFY